MVRCLQKESDGRVRDQNGSSMSFGGMEKRVPSVAKSKADMEKYVPAALLALKRFRALDLCEMLGIKEDGNVV